MNKWLYSKLKLRLLRKVFGLKESKRKENFMGKLKVYLRTWVGNNKKKLKIVEQLNLRVDY